MVSAGRDGLVKIWDANNGKELLRFNGHTGSVWTVDFSRDGTKIVSRGNSTIIWDAYTGEERLTIEGRGSLSRFNPSGDRIVGFTREGLTIWDVDVGQKLYSLENSTGLTNFRFDEDGNQVVGYFKDGRLMVWNANHRLEPRTLTEQVACVQFSPNGEQIVSGNWNGQVNVWDANKGKLLHRLKGHKGFVSSVSLSKRAT